MDTVPEPFCLNDWCVDPSADCISRDGVTVKIEAKHMRVLLLLVKHAGEIVSVRQIEDGIWRNEVVTQNSIHQAIAQLRKALGDDRKAPRYIETVVRKGYRSVAAVSQRVCASAAPHRQTTTARAPVVQAPPAAVVTASAQYAVGLLTRIRSQWQVACLIASALLFLATVIIWARIETRQEADDKVHADALGTFTDRTFSSGPGRNRQ